MTPIESPAESDRRPVVLFVCVHNAGRSQMAAAFLDRLAGGTIDVRSAGSTPADEVDRTVIEAMSEVGIDISAARPARVSDDAVRAADVVVTMGCGDACPVVPGRRYEDWQLDDPAGASLDTVRSIRDEIDRRVRSLVADLVPGPSDVRESSPLG
ncbi:MAG TPA: arsenate reductase ArsC [Actinomycetota bacterium]